ncbi:MAG TPA: L,D-transpeptidase [Pseudorhizobium sp.]|nr:L,D-transpeptidase [Pseudorhizobium sp.]
MKTLSRLALSVLFLLCGTTAGAETLVPETIENARIEAIAAEPPAKPAAHPDPAIVRLQVLLDRAGASPGVIDGFDGDNVRKAVQGFEALQKLPVDGKLDPDIVARLKADEPIMRTVEIRKEDVEDLVGEIPGDFKEMAELDHLGYASIPEMLSERFHMDIDLVRALNPDARFEAGETVTVVEPGARLEGEVKRIEADREKGELRAYAEDDRLIAVYPATIGSDDNPSPSGTHKVKGVARMPPYTYDPDKNFQQGDNREKLTLPKGPNNPVGTVWIDLTEPTYGIHGTPEPSLIDKTGSHGCIRLANWDAEELSDMVKPGVTVEFVDGK